MDSTVGCSHNLGRLFVMPSPVHVEHFVSLWGLMVGKQAEQVSRDQRRLCCKIAFRSLSTSRLNIRERHQRSRSLIEFPSLSIRRALSLPAVFQNAYSRGSYPKSHGTYSQQKS